MAETNVRDNPQPITVFTLGSMAVVGPPYDSCRTCCGIPYPWELCSTPKGCSAPSTAALKLGFWSALTVPLLMMAGTDLLIWQLSGYSPFDPWVYGALFVSVLLGRLLIHTKSAWLIGGCTLLAGAQFFLVTNFGTWLSMSGNVDPNEIPAGQSMILDASGHPMKYARSRRTGLLMAFVMLATRSFPLPRRALDSRLP